jgi:hypothetical protein
MRVLIFSTTFVGNISHSKKKWARYKKMFIGFHASSQLFSSDFNETWILPTHFLKIFKYQISWKSVEWEPSCSKRTEGKTWQSWRSLFAILWTRLKMEVVSAGIKWRVRWRWAGKWTLLRPEAIMVNTNQRLFPSRKLTTSGSVKVKVTCVSLRDPFLENV